MKLKNVLVTIAAVTLCIPGQGVANANETKATSSIDYQKFIQEFVDRMHNRGQDINPADLAVYPDSGGFTIAGKNQEILTSDQKERHGGPPGTSYVVESPKGDLSAPDGLIESGVRQEPVWLAQNCRARINQFYLPPAGSVVIIYVWMDFCTQYGKMDFASDPARHHWVFKGWATCGPSGGNLTFAINNCGLGVDMVSNPNAGWDDWEPRADATYDQCSDVSMSITVGPFSAPITYKACEEQDLFKQDSPMKLSNTWRSRAVIGERSTAFLMGFHVPNSTNPQEEDATIWVSFSVGGGSCSPVGFDPCGWFIPITPI